MSLSKVYKESKNFRPEEILPRAEKKDSSWPAPVRPKHAFIEAPPGKTSAEQGFQGENLISPSQKAPPATPAVSLLGNNSLPGNSATPDDHSTELGAPEPETASWIDPLVVDQMVEEAFGRGIEEGLRRAETDFGSATVALLELCQQLDRMRETLLRNSFAEMQDLVLAIAEKIIRTSVLEQDTTLLTTIEEAIHSAVKSDEFYIYVNPEDFDTVQEKSAELVAGVNGLNNIVIKKDPKVERGGCKVESDNCIVDATIASQFEIIREKIKDRLSLP